MIFLKKINEKKESKIKKYFFLYKNEIEFVNYEVNLHSYFKIFSEK